MLHLSVGDQALYNHLHWVSRPDDCSRHSTHLHLVYNTLLQLTPLRQGLLFLTGHKQTFSESLCHLLPAQQAALS